MSHSWLSRANALGTFAGTVLAFVCIAVTATDYFHKIQPFVAVEFVGTEGLQKEFGNDRAHIVFNLTADLRSEFTWNTKQLFVYINFEFATRKNVQNQMVMWSVIIEDKYPYALTDQGSNLCGREFSVTVAWNMMPRVGALYTRRRVFSGLGRLPAEYMALNFGQVRLPNSNEVMDVPTSPPAEEVEYYGA